MKKHIFFLLMIAFFSSCSNNESRDFDNWRSFKVGQSQRGAVENYTEAEISKLEFKEIDFSKLKPLLERFEEIDSTKIPIWFDNMPAIVGLKNGDTLKIDLGFPTALFRDTKTRKVYILRNKYYAHQWESLVFGELILR